MEQSESSSHSRKTQRQPSSHPRQAQPGLRTPPS
ncbi:hypothetical protein [Rhodopirellula europaea]|nr:hypothetical protein [Rhodopirellula europaea]